MSETQQTAATNPLLTPWQTPFETPPFAEISPEHFLPAFEQAFADHAAEISAITHDPATPYKAGVDLANQLRGSLLTFDGTQHTVVFQGDSCIDDYATAYLIGGTTPPSGAKC